jgi:hypothetical protein
MKEIKFLKLVPTVLSTPLHELVNRALAGELEHDPIMTLPDEYLPSGHHWLGQVSDGAPAFLSMLRALGPYESRFDTELRSLASRSASAAVAAPAILSREKVSERSSALRTLLEAATLVQYPTVAGAKHNLVEGTVMVSDDEILKPLWEGDSSVDACWQAFTEALSGNYENAAAVARFEANDYSCAEHHETENPELCFDANSNPVTRSLLHFWAFAAQEKKSCEPPTNDEQLEAWKADKTGADIARLKKRARALHTFVSLGNQFFFIAVQDFHPSIRCPGGRGLTVLKDHMVVQAAESELGDLFGGLLLKILR